MGSGYWGMMGDRRSVRLWVMVEVVEIDRL